MSSVISVLFAAFTLLGPQLEGNTSPDLRHRPDTDNPTRVEVSFYLIDLSAVNGATQSFDADVVVGAKWRDLRLADTYAEPTMVPATDLWSPRLAVVNRRSIDRTLPEELRVFPDGTVTYVQRFIGTFSAEMNLREFPLDRQRFYVQVVGGSTSASIEFVPGTGENLSGQSPRFTISDWRVGTSRIEPAPLALNSAGLGLAGIAVVVEAERELRYYVVQVVVPLMMIVTMAWTVFWIDPSVVPTRLGVVVTTMLTLIAYRFALSNLLPRLSYLTRLDWFMLGSTSLILATLLTMAAAARLQSHGKDETVAKLDRWGRVTFAVAALVVWTVPWLL
jgi:hypothetical protein